MGRSLALIVSANVDCLGDKRPSTRTQGLHLGENLALNILVCSQGKAWKKVGSILSKFVGGGEG